MGASTPVGMALRLTSIVTQPARWAALPEEEPELSAPNRRLYPIACTGGLRHLVLTCPATEPSMRCLSVSSPLCAPASFRPLLAELPLPSASG